MLRTGDYLQDRYEILEQIGSGGMSVVYKAMCHKLKRLVAIKVLKEEFCSDSNFVSKFKMEAQAAAGLAHPNIVSIYDVVDEGRLHYIVMELIEGITLKTYISRKGRLEIKESVGIAIQVAQGIAAAHEQHIIHRDIKPQNMLISKDGKVKVADFGIARAVSAQTMNSAAMGSVHYISPEQARGGLSDERSDIYSLGITIYEMVTGRVPYDGESTVAVALAHLEDALVPPSVYNSEIPASLERIIVKCAEKKPERRYSSVNEVITDLRHVLVQPEESHDNAKALSEFPIGRDRQNAAAQTDVPDNRLDGGTRKITQQELGQIQEASDERRKMRERERKIHYELEKEERLSDSRYQDQDPEDDVHPYIERMLAGAGVVASVIIVAVMVVVFMKVGGLFRSGTGLLGFGSEETVAESSSADALSDTEVYMPDVDDLSEDLAQEKLKESYLNMKVTYEFSDDVQKGNVIRQDPEAGAVVAKWSNVNVVISEGSDKVNLNGLGLNAMTVDEAKRVLESQKLTVIVDEAENDLYEKGTVISFEPVMAQEGSTVTLHVSSGAHVELVEVPDITGLDEADAIALLAEAGLMPGTTSTRYSEIVEKGYIISQSGGENGMIEQGGRINYVVSSGTSDGSESEEDPNGDSTEKSPDEESTSGDNNAPKKHQRYVASINNVYDMSYLIGPGASSASVTVMVRLHQITNGEDVYKTLTAPKTITGDVLLPISYTSIESMNGTDEGEVQVVEADTGAVLKSYPLTFFPMD
jgi:serine/threonine-protein kinase